MGEGDIYTGVEWAYTTFGDDGRGLAFAGHGTCECAYHPTRSGDGSDKKDGGNKEDDDGDQTELFGGEVHDEKEKRGKLI